jgi:hypothetical protein
MVLADRCAFLTGIIKWLYCDSESDIVRAGRKLCPFTLKPKGTDQMNFTIKWRFEETGDFLEQDYTNKKSIAYATKDWRKAWEMHESECAFFQITKI